MTYMKDVFGRDLYSQFIGFEDTLSALRKATEQTVKAASYPPYNIRQVDENKYVIEMAIAGFSKSDVEITLDKNKLVIKGSSKEDDDKSLIYKGIANRSFERSFTINDTVEIKDAEMVNGMLKVWLQNIVQTQEALKKIAIK